MSRKYRRLYIDPTPDLYDIGVRKRKDGSESYMVRAKGTDGQRVARTFDTLMEAQCWRSLVYWARDNNVPIRKLWMREKRHEWDEFLADQLEELQGIANSIHRQDSIENAPRLSLELSNILDHIRLEMP